MSRPTAYKKPLRGTLLRNVKKSVLWDPETEKQVFFLFLQYFTSSILSLTRFDISLLKVNNFIYSKSENGGGIFILMGKTCILIAG